MFKKILILGIISIFIVGCSPSIDVKEADNQENITEVSDSEITQPEEEPEETEEEPEEEPVIELILPKVDNDSGKVMIQTVNNNISYPFTTYIITSMNGESVVVDPTQMPSKDIVDINPVVIISTHNHPDHVDNIFTDAYDCEKIICKSGTFLSEDFNIYTINSSHSGDNIGADDNANNYLVVFEVNELRIAHMGDIGQNTLTDEQLEQLGDIDIAFMQFENSYSAMTLSNEKGFNLIEQLNPNIVIPTHYTMESLPVIEERYGEITEIENILTITKDEIPETPLTFYIISNNYIYQ